VKLCIAPKVDPIRDREAWLEWRKRGLGASDMPAVLGVSSHRTPLDVYLAKVGRSRPTEPTDPQRIGLACEPALATLYEQKTGRTLAAEQIPVSCEAHPHLLATLDGYTACGRIVELKTCGSLKGAELGKPGTDALPREWIVQAHHQMLVADAPAVDFAVLHGGFSLQFHVFTVERSDAWDSVLVDRGGEFWDRVVMHDPPSPQMPWDLDKLADLFPPDGSEMIADDELAAAANEWERFKAEESRLEAERKTLEGFIRSAMKGAVSVGLPDGRRLKRIISHVEQPARYVAARSYTSEYLRTVKGGRS
jgi:putative phage-type endonuclease